MGAIQDRQHHHGVQFPVVTMEVITGGKGVARTLQAGVDTFAAANVIGLPTAKALRVPLKTCNVKLYSLDGIPLGVIAETTTVVQIQGKIISLDWFVVENWTRTDCDCLLGLPAHRRLGGRISIDCWKGTAEYTEQQMVLSLDVQTAGFDGWHLVRADTDFNLYKNSAGCWGFTWKWTVSQPELPSGLPKIYQKKWFTDELKQIAVAELQKWVDTKIMSQVPTGEGRRWVPINLIHQPHKTTKVRATLDLTALNKVVQITEECSTNEVCGDALRAFRRIPHGFVVDVTRAYLQVRVVDPEQRRFLTFCVDQKMFEMNVLPFGLNIGPKVLYRILYDVLGPYKETIAWYRDDIVIPTKELVNEVVEALKRNG